MLIPLHDRNPLTVIPFQFATVGVIGLCVVTFLWQQTLGEEAAWAAVLGYGMIPAVLSGAETLPPELVEVPGLFTLLTSLFLHGGWWHLAGNMLFLWVFGDNIEDALGHARFVVFYLLCGGVAGLTEMAADPGSVVPLVGASGAVSGVMGAYLMLHPRVRVLVLAFNFYPVRIPAMIAFGVWLLLDIVGALDGRPGIAWFAHLGGFAAGALLVVPMRRAGVVLFDRGVEH